MPSTLLVAPLKDAQGGLAGVLTAGRRNAGGFTIEERSLLEMAGRTSLGTPVHPLTPP